jgi:hypothetical protein
MSRSTLLSLFFIVLPAHAVAAEVAPPQWIVVTAPAFRTALEPLCDYRKAEGMKVVVIPTTDVLSKDEILASDGRKLAERLRAILKQAKGTSYVLLFGCIEKSNLLDPADKIVPPIRGSISRMKDQPTDNPYGCLDESRLASVAVGRLPARTSGEAQDMVRKILAFERDTQPGEWRQRLTVLAGVPAFNPIVDKMVESMAMSRFGKLDPQWTGKAIYHNPASRFCVPDDALQNKAKEYVQEGQLLTLYFGHSWAGGLYAPKTKFLDRKDWAEMQIPRGAGIFSTFGCYGCQLYGPDGEGYGIAAIRNPSGPVAVTGSHGICFAAMCQLAADGLFEGIGAGAPAERLGQAYLKLKQGIATGKMDALTFKLLDAVDGDSKIPQETQRQEHLEMFMLLGDPALKLPRIADSVRLETVGDIAPGRTITVRGQVSEKLNGGKVRLTLERPLTSDPPEMAPLPLDPPADRCRIMMDNHQRANRFDVETLTASVEQGTFQAKVMLPEKLPWSRLLLRAYVTTDKQEALGVLALEVPK